MVEEYGGVVFSSLGSLWILVSARFRQQKKALKEIPWRRSWDKTTVATRNRSA